MTVGAQVIDLVEALKKSFEKPTPAEIPLLLKGPLVRQFLAGRKTVTRRLDLKKWQKAKPGDLIWFRENCAKPGDVWIYEADEPLVKDDSGERVGWWYGSRFIIGKERPWKWTPSIHMPKTACRCWAEIVSIRVEKLRDIEDADIQKEGVVQGWAGHTFPYLGSSPISAFDGAVYGSLRSLWAHGWNSINGDKPGCLWDENPLVARIEFRRIER